MCPCQRCREHPLHPCPAPPEETQGFFFGEKPKDGDKKPPCALGGSAVGDMQGTPGLVPLNFSAAPGWTRSCTCPAATHPAGLPWNSVLPQLPFSQKKEHFLLPPPQHRDRPPRSWGARGQRASGDSRSVRICTLFIMKYSCVYTRLAAGLLRMGVQTQAGGHRDVYPPSPSPPIPHGSSVPAAPVCLGPRSASGSSAGGTGARSLRSGDVAAGGGGRLSSPVAPPAWGCTRCRSWAPTG